MSSPSQRSLEIQAGIGAHEKECRESGPVAKLRGDMGEMRGSITDLTATVRTWGRVLTVGLGALGVYVAVLTYVRSSPAPVVRQASAAVMAPSRDAAVPAGVLIGQAQAARSR